MWWTSWVASVLLVIAAVVPAAADDGESIARRRARAMRAYTLTEELALDEATAAKLFPLLARFDAEVDKGVVRRLDVNKQLLATTAKSDPRAIDALVDEALATQRWQRDVEDRRLGELRKILAPLQIARVVVLLPTLDARTYTAPLPDEDDDAPMPSPKTPPPVKGKRAACDPFNARTPC